MPEVQIVRLEYMALPAETRRVEGLFVRYLMRECSRSFT